MKQNIRIMMEIVKSEALGVPSDVSQFLALSEEDQQRIAALAKKHSIAQLLGNALGNAPEAAGLKITGELFQEAMAACISTEQIEEERVRICQVLDRAEIPYICLKGARIRPYYPEPWMRTSCDNDVLVHEADVERAARLLVDTLDYQYESRNYHDISLYSASHVSLELHFSIKENSPQMDQMLERVWDFSKHPDERAGYEYVQSDEYFIFHLVAHMVHHFVNGGCGIRPFLDLFLLQRELPYHDDEVMQLCREAGIARFYQNVKRLIDVWFRGAAHTDATNRMEDYIVSGGTYGICRNQVAVEQQKGHIKMAPVFRSIFATTEHLAGRYPEVKRHRWLMPIYQVRRWITAFQRGRFRDLKEKWKLTREISLNQNIEIEKMLRENDML